MNIKLQQLNGKNKLKFCQSISNTYGRMKYHRRKGSFHFEENPFPNNDQGIGKIFNEVYLKKKLLKTKPRVKSMNIKYYDLFYPVIKNRDEIEGNEKILDIFDY